jgi:tetratricopeptide (TPR) repeat protein
VGDGKKASEWFQRAHALEPTDSEVLVRLGLGAQKAGDWKQAEQYLQEVIKFNPMETRALRWLCRHYAEGRKYGDAKMCLELMVKCEPDDPSWRTQLISCYRLLGQHVKALEYARDTIQLFPHNEECKFCLVICI